MTGNVVVTQGANVMRGERMVVNLTTGVTRVEFGQGTPDRNDDATGRKGRSPTRAAPAGREGSTGRKGRESDAGTTQDRSRRPGADQLNRAPLRNTPPCLRVAPKRGEKRR